KKADKSYHSPSVLGLIYDTVKGYNASRKGYQLITLVQLYNLEHLDWDSRKTYLYHCYVSIYGTYRFKAVPCYFQGPFLNTRSHLQRELGNEQALIVQFTDDLDPDMPFDQQSWIATHQNTSDKNSIGFRITWRTWIKACLESSPTLILVNESLTSEFNVRRGLRQGDRLSPFVVHHHYRGSPRGYFGFADDVIIMSDWSSHNVENIIRIFKIFFLNLGLKINIRKSSIYGVGCLLKKFTIWPPIRDVARVRFRSLILVFPLVPIRLLRPTGSFWLTNFIRSSLLEKLASFLMSVVLRFSKPSWAA
nr:RNA-dependent RNA polymerase, eukaryotic-type [Tanacetum cinerariifolium]